MIDYSYLVESYNKDLAEIKVLISCLKKLKKNKFNCVVNIDDELQKALAKKKELTKNIKIAYANLLEESDYIVKASEGVY